MPRFSTYFHLGLSQHQLDFVDVSNEQDTPVYVDPYAIEIRNDIWAEKASEYLRNFFLEVLEAIRTDSLSHAAHLMSHLTEPQETFLGVSCGIPRGRGVGFGQAQQLINGIRRSKAFKTGILADLSEMALYVEGIDRDKISDLTTNIIRQLLVQYTLGQCEIHGIEVNRYIGPPMWSPALQNWVAEEVALPYINKSPILLVPKYIVRRKLSLDSQEFYNKNLTEFFIAEHLRANDSLVHVIRRKKKEIKKVYKGEVRRHHPKSKDLIADTIGQNPQLLELYREIAKRQRALEDFGFEEDAPSLSTVCATLITEFDNIKPGTSGASAYHKLAMACLTALFYPDLINPHKEWEINDGRKRIDIVFINSGDQGFFSQRRVDRNTHANIVIVECKNYSNDIENAELDQLIGRFDDNKGKFGIVTCRNVDKPELLHRRGNYDVCEPRQPGVG